MIDKNIVARIKPPTAIKKLAIANVLAYILLMTLPICSVATARLDLFINTRIRLIAVIGQA